MSVIPVSIVARAAESRSARQIDDRRHFRLRHLEWIHAAEPLTLNVHRHHDAVSVRRALVKDGFENLDDEVHRGVVVVEQEHLEKVRLLRFLPGPFEDLAARLPFRPCHGCLPILTL